MLPNNINLILTALHKGGCIYASVSGGKDGQAMSTFLHAIYLPITGFIHADLGRVEWKESMEQCNRIADRYQLPLHIITRSDSRDMLDHWRNRMLVLRAKGKDEPFWSSAKNRYCTSDMKRDPINKFLRNCGHNLVISAEGIRGDESTSRSKKECLVIRSGITSTYYDGMTVEEAISNYHPNYRLALTWFPIFHFTLADVWATEGLTDKDLQLYRSIYKRYKYVHPSWTFHAAYVYGNDRVSCMFCILGSLNDLETAAQHNPQLLEAMIAMEEEGKATFKHKFSLKQLSQ